MKIATLSIGDELLTGETLDTNAARIARQLYDHGFEPVLHQTVRDREREIVSALRDLADRHDAVIVSGGLGPTDDDLTGRAAAEAAGCRLVLHDDALSHLRQFRPRVGETLHPSNDRQALLPARVELLPNPLGTACGFVLPIGRCRFFFMPGVPAEMANMLANEVLPRLYPMKREKSAAATVTVRVFGLPEADIGARLQGNIPEELGLEVAYCVEFPEVLVKLRGRGHEYPRIEAALSQGVQLIVELLKERVVSTDGRTLPSVAGELLNSRELTLATAESCTGGLIAKLITDLPGSSRYFSEGVVSYANSAKIRLLGLSKMLIEQQGAVSAESARAMATGLLQRSGVDLALATTGIAGPGGGTPLKPVGTVFIALATRASTWVKQYQFNGHREEVRTLTAYTALDWIRCYLTGRCSGSEP